MDIPCAFFWLVHDRYICQTVSLPGASRNKENRGCVGMGHETWPENTRNVVFDRRISYLEDISERGNIARISLSEGRSL